MRWASLLAVFAAAKLLLLWDRRIEWSAWTPIAYFWQDAAVALLFALLDRFARRAWLGWTLYALAAGYAAINVPIARAISSPLTWPMLRAVHGTLADSIIHYATWGNLAALLAMGAAAVGFPIVFYRAGADRWAAAPLALVPLAALGPFASARVETLGLERNPLAALALTAMPRVAATSVVRDWRASPLETIERDELSHYRGTCSGRNVMLVVLESAAACYLRPYGAAQDPMPNLTRLAGEGLLVENAYVVYPESIKGLFALLTSTYPAFDTAPEEYERAGESSLATQLAGEGYRTGLFHSGRFMYLGMEAIIRGRGFETLEDAGDIGGNQESSFGVDERATVERMLAWIDADPQDRPFFITYLPIAGHHPYATPEPGPFGGGEEIDQYRNALDYADQALGELLAGFGERGLERETLLVVLGDHGQAFGQHEGNHGHTLFLYEENVHVPLVIWAPGALAGPARMSGVASGVDIAPTVLDLLGLGAPAGYQGRSLLQGSPGMALFFTDYSLGFVGLRDGRWKFIHQLDDGRSKLFDVASDPAERVNLAGRHPQRAAAYRRHLLDWLGAQRGLIQRGG